MVLLPHKSLEVIIGSTSNIGYMLTSHHTGSTYYIQSIAVITLKKKDKSVGSKSECRPDTQM